MSIFENPLFILKDGNIFATEHLFTIICGCYLAFVAIHLIAEILGDGVPRLFRYLKSKIKKGEE